MATIDQRGPYQFRARVRRRTANGTVTVSETFETRNEASNWAAIQDGKIIGDEYVDRTAIRQMTVRQSCEWFLDRIAPLNRTTGKRRPKTKHLKRPVEAAPG